MSDTYGYCPECGAPGVTRERRPDGNDRCANGHTYPSRAALSQPQAAQPADTLELDLLRTDFKRECDDTDSILRMLGLDPENCRTDGGSLKCTMILDALEARDRMIRRLAVAATPPTEPQAAQPLQECADNDSPWLVCKTCAATGKCAQAAQPAPQAEPAAVGELPPLPHFPERLRDYLMPAERAIVDRLLREYGQECARAALASAPHKKEPDHG